MASVGPSKEGAAGGGQRSPPNAAQQQQQGGGQSYQPMDKASSQTVKLNPKLELSHTELLKLLSYMEAELQARDVVIATLKTERIKSLLAYGRGGVHDPVLALQRDASCAAAAPAAQRCEGEDASQQHMRVLQDTQLSQLEHLISQQRKAHQRMRHVLREAEKRHSRVVGELEEERRKHEHDTAQGDDVAYALERDRTRLKQNMECERSQRRTAEAEVTRLTNDREQMQQQHKQMVLLLLEDRNRLALQAAHYRNRAEQLAKLVSEEKGRMDGMAEGLEEESKKSLQMEAQMEKQLALFDAERQQMRGLLQRRDDRSFNITSCCRRKVAWHLSTPCTTLVGVQGVPENMECERSQRRTAEAEVTRLTNDREQMQQQHKQMVLLLLEDRNRLALQAAHYRNRAEQLAKLVSEEKGRMDGMAEGLEEESKKSLQMEAQMEKQLALFDAERQQMRGLLQRRDDRTDGGVTSYLMLTASYDASEADACDNDGSLGDDTRLRLEELETTVEKLQRDVGHYQKQLQEAHNVAMFQQQLSVSPPQLTTAQHLSAAMSGTVNAPSVTASVVTGVSLSQAPNTVSIPSLSPISSSSASGAGDVSSASPNQSATLPSRLAGSSASKTSVRPQPPQLPAKPPQLSHHTARQPGTLPPPKVSARVRASSPGVEESSHSPLLSSQPLAASSHGGTSHLPPSPSPGHAHSYLPYPNSSHSSCRRPKETTWVDLSSPRIGGSNYESASGVTLIDQGAYETPPTVGEVGLSKAVQLTATVNSVPVSLPTTGIARAVQPPRAVLYSTNPPLSGADEGGAPASGGGASQVVQLSPRVNVSASGTGKVITSNQGGKFTFQVSTTSPPHNHSNSNNEGTANQQQLSFRKPRLLPAQSTNSNRASRASSTNSSPSPRILTNSTAGNRAAPPLLPPNKPLLSKSDSPISVEVKPHKLGPQTLKFGITISKSTGVGVADEATTVGLARREAAQVSLIPHSLQAAREVLRFIYSHSECHNQT
ncbi:Cortactin-binding protein-2 N-terminal [Trinorchestia longiramus]|nr:Cortactin-binding protein-2 N-terminal [Trinorchestia longiramus]